MSTPSPRIISNEQQTDIVRLVVQTGMRLQQHGAESKLVEQTSSRLGLALGLDSVEIALTANAIIVTGLYQGRCITTTRRVFDRGINMHVVCEVQRIVLLAEKQLLDCDLVKDRLERISAFKYNRWLVVFMVGLSCASFSHLFGGDWTVFAMTFIASAFAMIVRQELAHRHHNPIFNFGVTAFVATLISSLAVRFNLGNQPELVMAASVLLLVPGFPLINAVSDFVKGHVNTGMARWGMATLLCLGAASGIALAMALTGVRGWV
ncbi:threonine/serine exporter [Alginatibacterium sediminis]|uniref:Threonine/serine exporter n=1 Tax=Alginatibacterium sediminis TaxID=2164068 RepID=A0A420E7Z2_9ALTE|nr:threonine/serine exporter family protein [Alginatibacterium sediminis]RKF14535.1 threonine/serine exporter [Alginatibacterium sediminis]